MSIATQITRIQTDRNTIRNKLIELGLATATDNLTNLAEAIDEIVDRGDISATVKEGETYTIPAGYHSGAGTVSGIAGGGNYTLQSKTGITPTKKQQTITPNDGYYGLSDVVINPIPDAYQDVTSVTAAAADVLSGKIIVSSTGVVTAGTMDNNGAVSKTLTTGDASYTVPKGYHSGAGTVKIVPEDKSATPTKSAQTITATSGKVLNKVTVNAIPDAYQDVTNVTATANKVLTGSTFVDADGTEVEGTMTNNGAKYKTLTTSDSSYTIPRGWHNGSGMVGIISEDKSVTPTTSSQTITASEGKVLDTVTVAAIPSKYIDASKATDVTADKVLNGYIFVNSSGIQQGDMPNNGSVTATIDGLTTTSYTIPKGYHDGTGTVSLTTEIEDQLAGI